MMLARLAEFKCSGVENDYVKNHPNAPIKFDGYPTHSNTKRA